VEVGFGLSRGMLESILERWNIANGTCNVRVKLTQAGFTDCVDTEEMAVHYFDQMATDKLLPTRKQLDGM
jgi:hypothetical protein